MLTVTALQGKKNEITTATINLSTPKTAIAVKANNQNSIWSRINDSNDNKNPCYF